MTRPNKLAARFGPAYYPRSPWRPLGAVMFALSDDATSFIEELQRIREAIHQHTQRTTTHQPPPNPKES